MKTELQIKQIRTSDPEYPSLLKFRDLWLRKPLGLSLFDESLEGEKNDLILIATSQHTILGCVMLQPKNEQVIQLRQMAIDADCQGQGEGRKLVTAAENLARQHGYQKIILHARITARKFYERCGYEAYGEIFTEVTIPHIAMQKQL